MLELGHEPLAITRDYLADVRKPGEAKKAVAQTLTSFPSRKSSRRARTVTEYWRTPAADVGKADYA